MSKCENCSDLQEQRNIDLRIIKAFEQEIKRNQVEYSIIIDKLREYTCIDNANKHRVDNQDRLVRTFKEHIIKGVIDFDKEQFIKYVIDYQFENSRGFKRG